MDKLTSLFRDRLGRWIIIFAVLTLLTTAFIFGNSLRSHETSDEQSKTVASIVDPTIDPQGGVDDYELLNVIIRKLAHMAEFGLLGAVVFGLIRCLREKYGVRLVGVMLFAVLAAAVIDESLQYLVPGRSALVSDVLIDFCGAALGIVFGLCVSLLVQRSARRAEKQ